MMKEIQQTTRAEPIPKSADYKLKTFIAGGIAGCAAKTAIAPLDRVKILFQASNPAVAKYAGSASGVFYAMGEIYSKNGIIGLFQGNTATLARIFPYAAIKFMAYEQFKMVLVPKHQEGKSNMQFVAGSLSGMTSVVFTYPMDMVRARMAYETENPQGLIKTVKNIYQEPSASKIIPLKISNFYRGFVPTMLGMVPYAGMSFWTQSKIKYYLQSYHAEASTYRSSDNKIKLKTWAELVSGGLAGAIAQTVSYPLEVIRRKMQVSGRIANQHTFESIRSTALHIVRTKGIKGFYVGLTIGYIKVTPMAAIAFYTYEKTKQLFGVD